jgi:protein tyrosine kinase modulator
MELRYYWRVFRRRAWIPVVLAIVAALTAGAVVFVSKPSYTATATAMARSMTTGVQPVSFQQAASSNTVAVGVIQKLGLNESVDDLQKQVHVTTSGNNLYRISVTDRSAQRASAISNELSQQATVLYLQLNTHAASSTTDQALQRIIDQLRQNYDAAATARVKFWLTHPNATVSKDVSVVIQALDLQINEDTAGGAYRSALDEQSRNQVLGLQAASAYDARVVDPAVAKPDTGGRIVEILSAGALALILGIGLVFLLEYLDNAVREPELAEEIVGAPVIGVIPRANPHSLRTAKGGA